MNFYLHQFFHKMPDQITIKNRFFKIIKNLRMFKKLLPFKSNFFASKQNISHFGETILNSSTSKLEHNLATLPTFKGPFGSTNINFKLEKFFSKIIQGYQDILIN